MVSIQNPSGSDRFGGSSQDESKPDVEMDPVRVWVFVKKKKTEINYKKTKLTQSNPKAKYIV